MSAGRVILIVRGAPSNGRPYRDRRQFITVIGRRAPLDEQR